jgi:hypothetical protein
MLKIETSGSIFSPGAKYEVYVDKVHICDASTLFDGLQLVWALHYVFDIHFSSQLRKTYTFLSSYVVGIAEPQIATAQQLYNKIA